MIQAKLTGRSPANAPIILTLARRSLPHAEDFPAGFSGAAGLGFSRWIHSFIISPELAANVKEEPSLRSIQKQFKF